MKDNIKSISIHTPQAGRDQLAEAIAPLLDISIHTPQAGRDLDEYLRNIDR